MNYLNRHLACSLRAHQHPDIRNRLEACFTLFNHRHPRPDLRQKTMIEIMIETMMKIE